MNAEYEAEHSKAEGTGGERPPTPAVEPTPAPAGEASAAAVALQAAASAGEGGGQAPASEAPAAQAGEAPAARAGEQVPAAPVVEAPRRRSHVAPAHLPLERIDEDGTYQMKPLGDLSRLATDLARLGQLFPVDVRFKPPDRFQVVCGFRRVAALRFLKRDRVLARLHTDLSDEDALLMALAAAIHESPAERDQLEAKRKELEAAGKLTPIARDMLDKALAKDDGLASETVEQEVDADELAADATQRLGALNQDLALLADVFSDLDATRREELLNQLRYSSELVAWLESL